MEFSEYEIDLRVRNRTRSTRRAQTSEESSERDADHRHP